MTLFRCTAFPSPPAMSGVGRFCCRSRRWDEDEPRAAGALQLAPMGAAAATKSAKICQNGAHSRTEHPCRYLSFGHALVRTALAYVRVHAGAAYA